MHAATIDGAAVGPRRNLSMPGVAVSVAEQIEALGRVAGESAAALISDAPDAAVWALVKTWPGRIAATRARELGFEAESNFDDIITAHIADEIGATSQSISTSRNKSVTHRHIAMKPGNASLRRSQ
jgi:D-erythronate 2-dehydrogenase